ncbi:hypothetical protein NX059_007160 [Plenodomus lindquistii]|nr:hypothetical protein NX059_007160 [Plenodomus lindquistii]
MHSFIALLFLMISYHSFTLAIPAAAPVRPAKGAVSVSAITVDVEGSGCKKGSVSVNLAADNSAMTIIFDKFVAADGPKAIYTETRALCKVDIGMKYAGWAFDISSADFRGYVWLEKGVNASLVSRWKWIDKKGLDMPGKRKGNVQKKVTGPFDDDYLLHEDDELSDTQASVCQKKDATIQLSMSATVDSGTTKKNGYVQGGSADAAFKEILNMSWRKC